MNSLGSARAALILLLAALPAGLGAASADAPVPGPVAAPAAATPAAGSLAEGSSGDSEPPNFNPGAINFTQPLFTPEGYRSLTLRGSSVRPIPPANGGPVDRIDVTDMSITVFSGKADARVDSVLLSPAASFFLGSRTAAGDGPVRLVRDDVDARGEGWTYSQVSRKVTLARDVHVVFNTLLPDLLK